jgi:urease beta subunit
MQHRSTTTDIRVDAPVGTGVLGSPGQVRPLELVPCGGPVAPCGDDRLERNRTEAPNRRPPATGTV